MGLFPGQAPLPWYNVSLPFAVQRIALRTELFGTAERVEVKLGQWGRKDGHGDRENIWGFYIYIDYNLCISLSIYIYHVDIDVGCTYGGFLR